MWPESEQKIESSRDRHGEREKEGSRVRFSAHETVQGRGMNSVKLHCVCVCVCARAFKQLRAAGRLEQSYSMLGGK